MIWLKWIGTIILAASCSMGGILIATRLRRHITELERARSLIWSLIQRLTYTLAPPQALLEQLFDQEEYSRCDYLSFTLEQLTAGQPFETAWREGIRKSTLPLDVGDRALLEKAGDILGASDLQSQQRQLTLLTEQLESRLAAADVKIEANAKLATTLGVLLGLMIAVFII